MNRMHAEYIGKEIVLTDSRESRHFYCCPQRRSVLKELWFGLSNGEAGVLTADAGVGKTLLCRELLQRLPLSVRSLYLVAPEDRTRDFLGSIASGIQVVQQAGKARGAAASTLTIIIDEAQRLSAETLQRLTDWRERQIANGRSVGLLLVGRPELTIVLAATELDSKITARCSLAVFPQSMTESFIGHWVKTHPAPRVEFSEAANRIVHYASGGIPALISQMCARAIESVRRRGKPSVTALTAARAAWAVAGD